MNRYVLRTMLAGCCWLAVGATCLSQTEQDRVRFKPVLLTVDANEGVDLADVNNDGKTDVIAGRNWYPAPDFRPRPLRSIDDWNGYVQSNSDHAYDVNGDGWTDVVAGSFQPTTVHWYQNPGAEGLKLGQLWKQQLLVDTKLKQNEISFLRDLTGDGKPEWICNSWNKANPVVMWEFTREDKPKQPTISLRKTVLGTEGHGHGMGFGDINNDGHEDILVAFGWYERPAKDPFESGPWKFHADWTLPHASCPVIVRDLNGDGKNDLIWGSGHDYGLHWWEATGTSTDGSLEFTKHVIDDRYSQAHALAFADLDGDGADELITGKRVRAHNGNDPGGKEVPCMYYYRWDQAKSAFARYVIDEGHIGIGLQIRTADIDADGDVDIAVAGKDGTWILWNQGK